MGALTVEMSMPRRRAEVTINAWRAKELDIKEGIVPCHVLGLFQCIENYECAYPVFVCELADGRVIEVVTSYVRFVDTDGGAL